ncbi:hypothetical protein BgiMline_003734 [Biomphalaria glabrata]|nr:hypothetical protein BgiMline_012261 [Biomphalaria glabrata]
MRLTSFLVCSVLTVTVVSAGAPKPSKNLYRFLTVLSGYFVRHDVYNGESDHGESSHLWKPVCLEAFPDKLTFYYETTSDGKIVNQKLWIVDEDHNGVIHVQQLNLLGHKTYHPKELENADFNEIEFQDLSHPPDCDVLFYAADQNVFVGTIPNCPDNYFKEVPKFGVTLTCYSVSYHVCNAEFIRNHPKLPFINFKKYSYPLVPAMTAGAHFETPCLYHL